MLIESRALSTDVNHHMKVEGICHCYYLDCCGAYLKMRLRSSCAKLLLSPSLPSPTFQGGSSTGITEITSGLNSV